MTPLEILALIVALFSIADILIYFTDTKKWFTFLEKTLGSKSNWKLYLPMLILILVFAYFALQQLTIIQIVPGLFLGVLLMKFSLVYQYPKEMKPSVRKLSKHVDWFGVALDLIIAIAVLWILFLK